MVKPIVNETMIKMILRIVFFTDLFLLLYCFYFETVAFSLSKYFNSQNNLTAIKKTKSSN